MLGEYVLEASVLQLGGTRFCCSLALVELDVAVLDGDSEPLLGVIVVPGDPHL